MTDITASSFVREAIVDERPAPVKTTGFVGFLRTRLLNSPTKESRPDAASHMGCDLPCGVPDSRLTNEQPVCG